MSYVKMLLPDDVIYHILLWLPVLSLLRFKSICKSWCSLIESSGFIKHHLHHHHYDCPSLKDKNHNLIFCVSTDNHPVKFLLASVHNFEAPTAYLQLDSSDLHECFPVDLNHMSSFDGIVCLNFYQNCNRNIWLWNPATKQSRLLPESPFPLILEAENHVRNYVTGISIGFGFDVKTNDYKVIKLIHCSNEIRVEVYNLSMDSWRRIDSIYPGDGFIGSSQIPFHNGNCFCWMGFSSEGIFFIVCFDFGSEMFRSISFPEADMPRCNKDTCVVNDELACVLCEFKGMYVEIWVLNDYGSANESWAKLYVIDPFSTIERSMFRWFLMNGNYLFFGVRGQLRRYNVVTKEAKDIPALEFQEILKGRHLLNKSNFRYRQVVQYKESLVSVEGGNRAPPC